jgi:Holliday junction resolvase RusA-like endonuclease
VLCGRFAISDGQVAVTLRVYRPRKSGDLDGRIKIVLDALQGVAYRDDSQVVALHAYRFDDKARPRVEVEVAAHA